MSTQFQSGFRFHLSLPGLPDLQHSFNGRNLAYQRGDDGRVRLAPPLREYRRVTIGSAADLVEHLKTHQSLHLHQAFAVAANQYMRFHDFLALQDHHAKQSNNERIAGLVSRLKRSPKGSVFCAMEISTEKGLEAKFGKWTLQFDPIALGAADDGPWEKVVPKVAMDKERANNAHFRRLFAAPGHYLVIGRPLLYTKDYDSGERVHYITMEMDDARNCTPFDYPAILKHRQDKYKRSKGIHPPTA